MCALQHACVGALVTSEQTEPLQAYLNHEERFLGLVQGDGLSALLLDVQLQMILQVTANAWETTETRGEDKERNEYRSCCYLRIENAEGYVLIAVYLFIYLFVCVLIS